MSSCVLKSTLGQTLYFSICFWRACRSTASWMIATSNDFLDFIGISWDFPTISCWRSIYWLLCPIYWPIWGICLLEAAEGPPKTMFKQWHDVNCCTGAPEASLLSAYRDSELTKCVGFVIMPCTGTKSFLCRIKSILMSHYLNKCWK